MGGGLPLAAYGGRADIMDVVAPLGPVYQAGTLSGNPIAVAAGRATLAKLRETPPYAYLDAQTGLLAERIRESGKRHGVALTVNQIGSMFTVFFTDFPVTDYASAKRASAEEFGRFFHAMLERGVYLPPAPTNRRSRAPRSRRITMPKSPAPPTTPLAGLKKES